MRGSQSLWARLAGKFTWQSRGNRIEIAGGGSLRLRWRIRFHPEARDNRVVIGARFRMGKLRIEISGSDNRLVIGDDVRWGGRIMLSGRRGGVSIGDRCHAVGVYLSNRGAATLIGPDCLFSHGIEIRSADMHPIHDIATDERVNPPADVTIGAHCWIAARAYVGKGAAIPDETIVGACAVVTGAFEERHTAIAGNPARVVRADVRWER